MPESRLAQFTHTASMIDNRPELVIGTMMGMIVLKAEPMTINHSNGQSTPAVHYYVWHRNLPHAPLVLQKPAPWIECDLVQNPDDRHLWGYAWRNVETRYVVLVGGFRTDGMPIAGAEKGVETQERASTAHEMSEAHEASHGASLRVLSDDENGGGDHVERPPRKTH